MRRRMTALFGVLVLALGLFFLGGLTLKAQGGPIINTVAGGNVGDGRRASEAPLNRPVDIVFDAAGNAYFVEEFYERVRRIDAVTGIITTVAGNGITGFGGDDSPATSASLNKPEGVAINAAGTLLYIADFNNNRVRQVDLWTGIITTFAGDGQARFRGDGGPATRASLNHPVGLAFDSAGNLYIGELGRDPNAGDFRDSRIRKVDTAGIITTFAGNGREGADPFYVGPATGTSLSAAGLAFDAMGNLYFADVINHLVRKIDRSGIMSTVAGDGCKVAFDRADPCTLGFIGNGCFQAESGPARLVRLNFPQDVAVDTHGNVYIADTANHRIRLLTPNGELTTVAGTSLVDRYGRSAGGFEGDDGPATMAKLNRPTGVAIDPAGNIVMADFDNDRLRFIDASGTIRPYAGRPISFGDGGPATSAGIYVTQAVAVDRQGNLFIAESSTGRVSRITPGSDGIVNGGPGEIITTVAGTGLVGFSGDDGPATQARLLGPVGLVVDSRNNLYISELLSGRIRKVVPGSDGILNGGPDEIITTFAGGGAPMDGLGDNGPAIQAELRLPLGLAVDATDNLYIADSCHHRIRRVDARTGMIRTVAGNGSFSAPSPCFPDDPCRGDFAGDGGPAIQASLWNPRDVAVDRDGNIIIADTLNFRIRMVEASTGRMRPVAGTGDIIRNPDSIGDNGPATRAKFAFPAAVAVDGAGNIFVADARIVNRIRRIDKASGRITTVAGTGDDGFSGDGGPALGATMRGPTDVAVMPDGSFVFTDAFNHRVRRVR